MADNQPVYPVTIKKNFRVVETSQSALFLSATSNELFEATPTVVSDKDITMVTV